MKKNALLLFSGGIDSTTSLYWGKHKFNLTALIFDYAQNHLIEVKMAEKIARMNEVNSLKIKLPFRNLIKSSLIDADSRIPDSLAESKDSEGVPLTYVPFRNGIFLSLAAAVAESHQSYDIITGFNIIDTPDYPDTTLKFTQKMQEAINCGTTASLRGEKFIIHTPLINKDKKEIIKFGLSMGADYSYSVSCYRGSVIPCLKCPSCDIRKTAFADLGMIDPLIKRLIKEGKI